MEFEAWRSWSGSDVAVFISHFCGLPEYAPSVQHNLTGRKLQHLASQGMLGKGLARAGIYNFEHQRLIASAVAQLGVQSPEELSEMLQERLEAHSGSKPTWVHIGNLSQSPREPRKDRTPRPGQKFKVPVLPRLPDPLPPADVRYDPQREEELSRRSRTTPRPYSEDPADGTASPLSEGGVESARKLRARVASSLREYEAMLPAVVGVRGLQQLQAQREEAEEEARRQREQQEREEAAALRIQAVKRGSQARQSVTKMKSDRAAEDQGERHHAPEVDRRSSYLEHIHYASDDSEGLIHQTQLELRQHAAAAQLQALHRGNAARKLLRQQKEEEEGEPQAQEAIPEAEEEEQEEEEKEEADAEEEESISPLQGTAEEEAAATRIQALRRGNQARREVEAMLVEQEEAVVAAAATKIQAAFRGNQARLEVEAMLREEEPGMLRDEEEQAAKEAEAATRIQALYRGAAARSDVEAMFQDSQGPLYEDSAEEAEGGGA